MEGKISSALKFLETETSKGILSLTDDILEELKEKQPHVATIREDSLLHGPIDYIAPSIFDSVNEDTVYKVALNTKELQADRVWMRNCIAEYFPKTFSGKQVKNSEKRLL